MRKTGVSLEYLPFWKTTKDTYLMVVEVRHHCWSNHLGQILVPTPEYLAGSLPQLNEPEICHAHHLGPDMW